MSRLAALNHDQAQQVLDELSGRIAIAQVKNPIRYCAALIQSMQRGEFVPELGLKVVDVRQAQAARQAELARIQKTSAIEFRPESRELPIELRERLARLRASATALSKENDH